MGVFPAAIAYVAWAYVFSRGPAGRTATLLYLMQVLVIFNAWIWLREVPQLISLTRGAVALAGVVLVNTRSVEGSTRPTEVFEEIRE